MTKLYSIKGLQALVICLALLVSSSIQAQVPSYVPIDGLVGYWPFNGNANDESGNGNDGLVNGATLTEDRFGNLNKAFAFVSANNQSIEIGDLDLISNYTISSWYKISTIGGYQNIVSKYGASGGYAVIFNPNGILYAHTNSGTSSGNVCNSSYSESSNSWHMVSVTLDAGIFTFYVDGIIYGACTGMNYSLSNDATTYFGRQSFGTSENFNGSLDDIGFWNRALTEDEIQDLYTGCNAAPTTIAGSVNPFTLTSSDYACNNNPGSTYEWTITNGVITAGQGTSNVTVLWGEEGAGTLTVVETNTEGCSGTPATIEVTIECATTATTLDGPLGPNALTETTYTCNGSANSTFEWTISNGVITSGQGTNSVTVLWAATGLGSISVQETTNANCTGDLISINVVVIPTSIDELNESNLFLYPNPAKEEITLQTNQSSIGSLYIIVDQSGKQIASGKITGTNTTIKLDQFASGMYTIIRDGKTSQQFQVIK